MHIFIIVHSLYKFNFTLCLFKFISYKFTLTLRLLHLTLHKHIKTYIRLKKISHNNQMNDDSNLKKLNYQLQ